MINALILHGDENNREGNWFPWLRDELEKKGYKVWVPDLPKSEDPVKEDWLHTVFSNKDWKFNKRSLIIGHSKGATFTLRVLENLSKGVKIHKAILVAGFVNMGTNPEFFNSKKSWVEPPFDWKKIKTSCDNFYFICSDNDRYQCGDDQGRIMREHLGGELIVKKGEDHFNLEKGPEYKQFPLLLEII